MEKLKKRKNVPYNQIVEMENGVCYAFNSKERKWDESKENFADFNGEEVYISGTVYEKAFKCDSNGFPIEMKNNQTIYYNLQEIQRAETVDKDGESTDYVVIGYHISQ